MIKSLQYIVILATIAVLNSCGIYRMNVANVPLMQQAGQVEVGGFATTTGYDAQAAVAVTNHMAVLANGSNTLGKVEDFFYSYKHSFGELGAGYFKNLSNGKEFEIYGLAGKGSTNCYSLSGLEGIAPEITKHASYDRYALQGNFARKHNKLYMAVTARLLMVHYYDKYDQDFIDFSASPKNYLYVDGYFTIQYSIFRFLKVSSQVGFSAQVSDMEEKNITSRETQIINKDPNSSFFLASPFICSMGLICNLNFFKAKAKEVQQ